MVSIRWYLGYLKGQLGGAGKDPCPAFATQNCMRNEASSSFVSLASIGKDGTVRYYKKGQDQVFQGSLFQNYQSQYQNSICI